MQSNILFYIRDTCNNNNFKFTKSRDLSDYNRFWWIIGRAGRRRIRSYAIEYMQVYSFYIRDTCNNNNFKFTTSHDYNRFWWIIGSCNRIFFFTSEILVIKIILNSQYHAIMIDFDGSLVKQVIQIKYTQVFFLHKSRDLSYYNRFW